MRLRLLLICICAMFMFSASASADPVFIPPGAPLDGMNHTFEFVEEPAADTADGQLFFLDFLAQPGHVMLEGDDLEFTFIISPLPPGLCPSQTCVLLHSDPIEFDPTGDVEGPFVITNPNDGKTFTFTIRSPPENIPEPTTMLLLGTGLAGVAIKMRKRLKT